MVDRIPEDGPVEEPRATDFGLRALSACGAVIFGGCFVVASFFPGALETRARGVVVERVAAEVNSSLTPVDSVSEPGRFGAIGDRLSAGADSLRAILTAGFSERLATALSNLCEYDCQDSAGVSAIDTSAAERQTGLLGRASEAAMSLARGRYSESVRALVRDLRIFAGINSALFILVLAASLFGPTAPRGSRIVLWLTLASTGVAIFGYIFVQDWFHTILFGSYVGYGYALWVFAVFATLIDWVVLRGRISQTVVSFLGGLLSASS